MYFPLQREHFICIFMLPRSPCVIIYTIAVHFIHIHDLFVSLRPFTILLILFFLYSPRLLRIL